MVQEDRPLVFFSGGGNKTKYIVGCNNPPPFDREAFQTFAAGAGSRMCEIDFESNSKDLDARCTYGF